MNRFTFTLKHKQDNGFHPHELFGITAERADIIGNAMQEVSTKEDANKPPELFQDWIDIAETDQEQAFVIFILGMKMEGNVRKQRAITNMLGLATDDLREALSNHDKN